jgi:hypothetical protein
MNPVGSTKIIRHLSTVLLIEDLVFTMVCIAGGGVHFTRQNQGSIAKGREEEEIK